MPFKDPAKKREYNRKYNREYDFAAFYERNPESHERCKNWHKENQKKISKAKTDYRREKRHSDPVAAAKHAEHCHTRRARLRAQVCDCCTKEELYEFWVIAAAKTEETGIPHEVDHIEPIAKGGAHCAKNLRVITMRENRQKGAA